MDSTSVFNDLMQVRPFLSTEPGNRVKHLTKRQFKIPFNECLLRAWLVVNITYSGTNTGRSLLKEMFHRVARCPD